MKSFRGKALFLDRSDINTDEIIPARYLTEVSKAALAPYLLEDLKTPGFDPRRDLAGVAAIVTRANFGCGSSREHAPWALEANGIHLVVASSFARIFRQNMFNCGMLALELPEAAIGDILARFASGPEVVVDCRPAEGRLLVESVTGNAEYSFDLPPFERALIEAGGWVEFADARY